MDWIVNVINDAENKTDLCFISYNSRGFGQMKTNFCKYLLSEYFVGDKLPILCNQENFVLRGNSYKINKNFPGFHLIINPAVKESHCKGRAKNGMFIAIPDRLKNKTEDVSPGHWRLQAIKIKTETDEMLNPTFQLIREITKLM